MLTKLAFALALGFTAMQVAPTAAAPSQYKLRQPYDDAVGYRQVPQWRPILPGGYPHSINPGGVGTDTPAGRG